MRDSVDGPYTQDEYKLDELSKIQSLWLAHALLIDEQAQTLGFRVGQDNKGNLCVKRGAKIVGGIIDGAFARQSLD